MKKIITICLLIAIGTLRAQEGKPSKEETLRFMDRTVKSGIGLKATGVLFFEITEASFDIEN